MMPAIAGIGSATGGALSYETDFGGDAVGPVAGALGDGTLEIIADATNPSPTSSQSATNTDTTGKETTAILPPPLAYAKAEQFEVLALCFITNTTQYVSAMLAEPGADPYLYASLVPFVPEFRVGGSLITDATPVALTRTYDDTWYWTNIQVDFNGYVYGRIWEYQTARPNWMTIAGPATWPVSLTAESGPSVGMVGKKYGANQVRLAYYAVKIRDTGLDVPAWAAP